MLWGVREKEGREKQRISYVSLACTLPAKNKSFAFVSAKAAALIMIYQMLDVEKYHAFLSESTVVNNCPEIFFYFSSWVFYD
jgi:hypothetical protein